MLEFAAVLGAVLGAFCLYMVVLPLVGLAGSVICRVFLPYLLGSWIIYSLLSTFLSHMSGGLLLMLSIIIWCVPALCARYWPQSEAAELGWQQGHYRAHFALLTFGLFSKVRQAVKSAYPLAAVRSKTKAG